MITKQTKFILAVALQAVIILAIIIFKLSILDGGTDILLKIEPIDPRDMLRGDYVTFQYDISNIVSYYANGQQIRNGDTVYVILRQSGKYWMAQAIQKKQPTESELFIKGKVESGGLEDQINSSLPALHHINGSSSFHIVYGVEQYFIPEGKGGNFNFRNKEAVAQIVVDDNGNAVLKHIYIDGKLWP
jgi:uncharacterized membrane-anchored protein